MHIWQLFWALALIVAGVSFAFITVIVTIKGFQDLRVWFRSLNQQNREEAAHPTSGEASG
jgi:hypothetical protein